jgi:hypothetical protein
MSPGGDDQPPCHQVSSLVSKVSKKSVTDYLNDVLVKCYFLELFYTFRPWNRKQTLKNSVFDMYLLFLFPFGHELLLFYNIEKFADTHFHPWVSRIIWMAP